MKIMIMEAVEWKAVESKAEESEAKESKIALESVHRSQYIVISKYIAALKWIIQAIVE